MPPDTLLEDRVLTQEETDEIRRGFHRAWTFCVGSSDYNKDAWNLASNQLDFALLRNNEPKSKAPR